MHWAALNRCTSFLLLGRFRRPSPPLLAPPHPPAYPHLPSALALGENILADSVRLRKATPLPMWLCGRGGAAGSSIQPQR